MPENDLRFHALFSDGAIVQSGVCLPIKGLALPGKRIAVSLDGRNYETVSSATGAWQLLAEPLAVGGPFLLEARTEGCAIQSEVLGGDVWLASGQSNMAWPLEETLGGAQETQDCGDVELRFFCVPKRTAIFPQQEISGNWTSARPPGAGRFSSVAYHFAKRLRRSLNIPIGVIQAAVGGTAIRCWKSLATREESLLEIGLSDSNEGDPDEASVLDRLLPAGCFNGLISPLVGFPIKGIIWYQGEGDNHESDRYEREFAELIGEWRGLWGSGMLPFFFVQLPGFNGRPWVHHNWPYLREAQLKVWRNIPNTGMAVAIDVGEKDNIHPRNKQPVGERLARWALHSVYGKDIVPSGPVFRSAIRETTQLRLAFDYAGNGLMTKNGEIVRGFEFALSDGVYRPVEARIDGQHVLLFPGETAGPFSLRYGWGGLPEANLYNAEELPAVPFRTDVAPFVAQPMSS